MKSKLIIAVTCLFFAGIIILLLWLHQSTKKEVVDRFNAEQLVSVHQLTDAIKSHLNDRTKELEALTSMSSIKQDDKKQMAADIQKFYNFAKINHIIAVSVFNEKGPSPILQIKIQSVAIMQQAICSNGRLGKRIEIKSIFRLL